MKVILCIVDGVGIPDKDGLSIPFIQNRINRGVLLNASGTDVGLTANQMGNSEVGHMTIGSGRIIKQSLTRINDSMASGNFPDIPYESNTYHLVGLLSDGGVHSHINHIIFLIKKLKSLKKQLCLHLITDGRDTPPQ